MDSDIITCDKHFWENGMKAVCISTFNYYDIRLYGIEKFLIDNGYDVTYITGDYDTISRQRYTLSHSNCVQLPMIPYHKNISLQRIYSHIHFAKKVYKQLQHEQPDLIYAMVPPNFIAYYIGKYKKKHPNVKVIFDVFDMWPESFPTTHKKWLAMPFKIWERVRTLGLKHANIIFTECHLFKERLQNVQPLQHCQVLYPFKKETTALTIDKTYAEDTLTVAYLGSINNIIDIDHIVALLQKCTLYKKVICHIIGGGEKHDYFMAQLQQVGVTVVNHGNIYDAIQKQKIFNQCDFGLNILKPSVYIGLTLKTIDYFYAGLPILNTLLADTCYFIENYQSGIMVNELSDDVIQKIVLLTKYEKEKMSANARYVYEQFLSDDHFYNKLKYAFDKGM